VAALPVARRDAGGGHAGAAVLHRLRAVDGLRGVLALSNPRVLVGVWSRSTGKPTAKEAHAANDESVAHGVARTGRVITAAALVMSKPFAALIAAHVSFMRMFGPGITLAVAADATLVRMVLTARERASPESPSRTTTVTPMSSCSNDDNSIP
jgi:hypothetical protein